MQEVILLKLGEIVLKGLNRNTFEGALLKNIRRRLAPVGPFDVRFAQSTISITPGPGADFEAAVDRVRVTEKTMESVCAAAVEYLRPQLSAARAFKVETKRSDKKFPLKSPEISAEVGAALLDAYPNLHVDVHNPDVTVRVEIRDFGAYVHGEPEQGAGGIPVGTGGKAALLISGGIDSPVAAWMMAKRGVELTPVHFASPPYTSERAEQKVADLLRRVAAYAGRMYMITVPFARVQEEILDKCPEEYFTILMRRFMMRISAEIAKIEGCAALITGESLGQVASQTMQAIAVTDEASPLPVFRPLIGMDKSEIVSISRKIDTYDLSVLPYEDCCTVFTPRHPRTRPELAAVLEAERALDVESLVRACVEGRRVTKITAESV